MFAQVPMLEIILRCVVVYIFVLLALRAGGKRQIGQMTPIDLVLLILISNAVQNAMTGPDTSLFGGILAASVLVLTNMLITHTRLKHLLFKRWLEGTPTLLIYEGQILQDHLQKEGLDHDELIQALREHGVMDPTEVRLAVLEVDGSISVVKNEDIGEHHSTRPYKHIRALKRGL